MPRLLAALLLLLAPAALAQPGAFSATGWLDAAAPRPAPATTYVEPCAAAGCREAGWNALLAARGEVPLTAPPGGRAYRYFVDYYQFGLGLKIVRLEVTAGGVATIASSYPGGRLSTSRVMPAEALAAFDAALAAARLDAAATGPARRCADGGDEVVFEALAAGRYQQIIEPCGGEAGLARAMEILDAQT